MRSTLKCVIVFAGLFAISSGTVEAIAPFSIQITEAEQPSVWTVDVAGFPSHLFTGVVAPNGRVIDPDFRDREGQLRAGQIEFQETFESLDLALAFVTGDWTTTEVTSRNPERAETMLREFSVGPITSDDINRSVPVITSPAPGFEAQNGEPFLLAWNYETPSADVVDPSSSTILSRRTAPDEAGVGRSIFSTPSGNGFSRGASGSPGFFTSRENEPGATSNRWMYTVSSNEALPQTFELEIGSWVRLDEFIDSPPQTPENPNRPFAVLSFSRFAEPLSIPLIGGTLEFECVIPEDNIPGDFDNNGTVEFPDFLLLSSNFGEIVTAYEEGDADCDNFVGFGDFLIVSQNFGRSSTQAVTTVPEPSGLYAALCGVGMQFVCRRRRPAS